MIIDAHLHLWDIQRGQVNGRLVTALTGGKSDFGGNLRQMMPPYMVDGRNTAEMLIANMDYARVSGCVVTQEYIDGNQDHYLLQCKQRYPHRMKICCLYEEAPIADAWVQQFDGIKLCAGRLADPDLLHHREPLLHQSMLDLLRAPYVLQALARLPQPLYLHRYRIL